MAPIIVESSKPLVRYIKEEPIAEDHDMAETQGPMEKPHNMISTKRRHAWACNIIREAKRYGASKGSKRPRLYSNYVALMCNLVDE